jgi:hypothetical protein
VAEPAAWFLASSARHVLLDAALAVARGGHNRLWLAEHIRAEWIDRYRAALQAWDGCPFASVTTLAADWRPALQGLHGLRHRVAKWRLKRRFLCDNRGRIEADLRAAPPTAMYVSCDTFHESQYALHLAQRHWPAAPRIHVEDGTAAYAYSFARGRWHDWPKEVVRRWRYGSWWRPCTLPGASGWLQEGLLMYPEHAIAGLRRLRLQRLDPALLLTPPMLAFARELARAFGLDAAPVRDADWIVTVANSRWSHLFPDYRALLARICRELLDRGQTIVL